MAALTCEICGGKLVGKPGGVFECDSCGMEYSTEWAKAKIQEIRGTVKVEGTVEVTGTVKVEGGASKESLLKRGQMFLEEGDWKSAGEYFDKVLDIDPECAEAYVGKFCALNHLETLSQAALQALPLPEVPGAAADSLEEEVLHLCSQGRRIQAVKYVREQTGASLEEARQRVEELRRSSQGAGPDAEGAGELINPALLEKALKFASSPLREELEGCQAALAQRMQSVREETGRRQEEEKIRREQEELRREEERRQREQKLAPIRERLGRTSGCIAANYLSTLAVKSDGTVVRTDGERCSATWRDIVAVTCGGLFTLALRCDGTAVAGGKNENGQCDVKDWRNIMAVACSKDHSVGLRRDGTVVAAGDKYSLSGCCKVSQWRDIAAVTCGNEITLGVKKDGTLVMVGDDRKAGTWRYREISTWSHLAAVACGGSQVVGLRRDGTVIAVGSNHDGQCNVRDWTDIVAVACGMSHTVGLRADGTVAATGKNGDGQCNVEGWTDIIAVACGSYHTVGLRADGSVVAAGRSDQGQCEVAGWKLFQSTDSLERARADAQERLQREQRRQAELAEERRRQEEEQRRREEKRRIRQEEQRRQEAAARVQRNIQLKQERTDLQVELAGLKGLFTGKRRREIEARLAEIDAELNKRR